MIPAETGAADLAAAEIHRQTAEPIAAAAEDPELLTSERAPVVAA